MPNHHQPSDLAAFGRMWIECWNSRDLERILALYDDAAEMTSDGIQALNLATSGTLHGKGALRAYWSQALALVPDLHFTLIDVFVSPNSAVVFYQNQRSKKVCEYLRVNTQMRIIQGSANHLLLGSQ